MVAVNASTKPRRFDLHGYPLHEVIHVTKCAECGMGLVSGAEFHPWRACEVFKETHNSDRVWEAQWSLARSTYKYPHPDGSRYIYTTDKWGLLVVCGVEMGNAVLDKETGETHIALPEGLWRERL